MVSGYPVIFIVKTKICAGHIRHECVRKAFGTLQNARILTISVCEAGFIREPALLIRMFQTVHTTKYFGQCMKRIYLASVVSVLLSHGRNGGPLQLAFGVFNTVIRGVADLQVIVVSWRDVAQGRLSGVVQVPMDRCHAPFFFGGDIIFFLSMKIRLSVMYPPLLFRSLSRWFLWRRSGELPR